MASTARIGVYASYLSHNPNPTFMIFKNKTFKFLKIFLHFKIKLKIIHALAHSGVGGTIVQDAKRTDENVQFQVAFDQDTAVQCDPVPALNSPFFLIPLPK